MKLAEAKRHAAAAAGRQARVRKSVLVPEFAKIFNYTSTTLMAHSISKWFDTKVKPSNFLPELPLEAKLINVSSSELGSGGEEKLEDPKYNLGRRRRIIMIKSGGAVPYHYWYTMDEERVY